MTITAGQLVNAVEALAKAGVDTSAAAGLGLDSLAADETVGEDVLAVVAIFWPPAGLLEMALPIALAIAELAIENPGSGANVDPLGRGGRRI
jgi:hypothetical protein